MMAVPTEHHADQGPAEERSPAATPPRPRVALHYGVDGELRYLSHHDELRMLHRALVRARWPLAYSQGFNPLPQLTVPLPRRLGTAADDQLALVTLSAPSDPAALAAQLHGALPPACPLRRVQPADGKRVPHATQVTYEIPLTADDATQAAATLDGVLAAQTLVIARDQGPAKPATTLDIRPYITGLAVDGNVLHIRLAVEQQRSARPIEILTELGLAASRYAHCVRRRDVQWDNLFAGPFNRPAQNERDDFGQERNNRKEDDA